MAGGGGKSCWFPECCPGHTPWASAGLALGACLDLGFHGGLNITPGSHIPQASSVATEEVITCPQLRAGMGRMSLDTEVWNRCEGESYGFSRAHWGIVGDFVHPQSSPQLQGDHWVSV